VVLLCFIYYNLLINYYHEFFNYKLFISTHNSKQRNVRTFFKNTWFIRESDQTCTKIKNQTICGGELKNVLKKSRKRDSDGNILKPM